MDNLIWSVSYDHFQCTKDALNGSNNSSTQNNLAGNENRDIEPKRIEDRNLSTKNDLSKNNNVKIQPDKQPKTNIQTIKSDQEFAAALATGYIRRPMVMSEVVGSQDATLEGPRKALSSRSYIQSDFCFR